MDPLEPVLEAVRAEAWVYCLVRGHSSWGLRIPPSDTTVFHSVRAGRCRIVFQDDPPVELQAGDFVVIPHGDEHLVVGGTAEPPTELLDAIENRDDPSLAILELGDHEPDGPVTELICGGFQLTRPGLNPLEGLPRVTVMRRRDRSGSPLLDVFLDVAADELTEPQVGSQTMLTSIGRVLLIETLRSVSRQLPDNQIGLLAAVRDPRLATVVAAIHHEPSRPWTIAELAGLATTSRSSLTALFRDTLQTTVGAYLAQWRMTLAASLLEQTDHDLSRIAAATGYGSEAAFSRAFKRHAGQPPITYRRHRAEAAQADEAEIPPLIQAAIVDRMNRGESR